MPAKKEAIMEPNSRKVAGPNGWEAVVAKNEAVGEAGWAEKASVGEARWAEKEAGGDSNGRRHGRRG